MNERVGRAPETWNEQLRILIPVFNDWDCLELLLKNLDQTLHAHRIEADLLIIDDGSTISPGSAFCTSAYQRLGRIEVVQLRRNLGHQRAIAIGLAYAESRAPCEALVVMDGDGEDDPADVPRLVERCRQEGFEKIVFAERARRSESLVFRACYELYKIMHVLLVGIRVRVGNFSVIPRARLESLAVVSELWNHYAAAAFKSRQPLCLMPTRRSERLLGRSRMNFVDLVVHGLGAISVFGEIVGVRLLVMACLLIAIALVGAAATVTVLLATDWAIPGWAATILGLLLVLLTLGIMLAVQFSFVILAGRQGSTFLPCRDYAHFIKEVRCLRE
jgi:glycosyltransferase involved in cell wall biosynthesis